MSTLFGAPALQTAAETTPHETALNVQSSSAGKVVSVVLGTDRAAGNLIWYGDFTAIAHQSSSGGGGGGKGGGDGGGGGSTSYTYTASTMVGLCVGTIQGVGRVWVADDTVSLSGLGSAVVVRTGAAGQAVWPWLASAHPSEALGYSGLAYVGVANADLGSSSSLPSWNWEIRGGGTPVNTDSDGNYDIGFPEAVSLIIESQSWGCGLVDIMGGLTDYAAWCAAHGFRLSDTFADAQSARELVQNYCKATLAEPVWSGDRLRIVPYADQVVVGESSTYVPDLTPALIIDTALLRPASSDDESPIKVTRKDPADFFNYLTVEYKDRSNDYNTATVTATDDGHIATYGQRPGSSINAHFIKSAEVAQHIADLAQGRELGVMAGYEFGVGPVGAILEPMDIVWINEPDLGLTDYPVRAKEVTEDEAFSFTITAEDIPGCIGAMVSRPVETGQGYRSQFNAEPAPCNPPVIFEAPAALTAGTGLEIWAAISGSDATWGGCQVWISTDGDTYKRAGTVQGGARTGALAAPLAAVADPDTTSTLSVSLVESRGTLLSGTKADADLFNTLCWVGGEIVSYQTATLTGANAYNLTYLRRGAYGSTVAAHSSGEQFARLDGSIFKFPFTADMIGQTIHVKALGFNQRQGGLQSLAGVHAYTYTITGREPPPAPSKVYRIGDKAVWEIAGEPLDLAGTYLRHLAGRTRNWEQGAAWPADGAITTAREIDLSQFGTGERTFMLRTVDTTGNLSASTAYLTVGLGEPSPTNVIITHDEAVLGFPGTIINGSVVDGVLMADDTGDLYLPDGRALYLPNLAASYLEVSYKAMVYTFSYVPNAADVPGTLIMATDIDGEGWQIEYRRRGSAGLYLSREDGAYLQGGDDLYLGGPDPWAPWPGILDVRREKVDFRITVEAGSSRGKIKALSLSIDVDDITESFEDIVVPAGGGRIPITKNYRAIDFIGIITLQDDGHGAVGVRRHDLNPTLGPLLEAVNGAGVSVQATIDIKDMKGH